MINWKPTKRQAIQQIACALGGRQKSMTIPELITDPPGGLREVCLTASEARRAMGWLYGRGRVKVAEIRNGEEAWIVTGDEDRVKK